MCLLHHSNRETRYSRLEDGYTILFLNCKLLISGSYSLIFHRNFLRYSTFFKKKKFSRKQPENHRGPCPAPPILSLIGGQSPKCTESTGPERRSIRNWKFSFPFSKLVWAKCVISYPPVTGQIIRKSTPAWR